MFFPLKMLKSNPKCLFILKKFLIFYWFLRPSLAYFLFRNFLNFLTFPAWLAYKMVTYIKKNTCITLLECPDSTNYKLAFKKVEGSSWSTKWHIFIPIMLYHGVFLEGYQAFQSYLPISLSTAHSPGPLLWEEKNRLSNYKEHLGNPILILAILLQFLFRVLSYLPELGFQQQRSSWLSWNPHRETKHNNFLQKTYLILRSRLKT